MDEKEDIFENTLRIEFLKDEIRIAQTFIRPTATGHIHTAINWMTQRLEDLKKSSNLSE
tara:strand:- start:325 stop:501 length:177 start_codon:yes stop_codon:yes gene_type:complete